MRIEELSIPEPAKRVITESGIESLYPPQEAAVKAGALEGQNLVLASPTASGKTLVTELCLTKHVLERGGKVLYLTPLRALASEKYDEFRKYASLMKGDGAKVGVAITTGDYDSSDPWLSRFDIIVTTNEKADSLLRHKSHWMDEVTLIVADEIHLMNEADRGPTLEVILTRLMETNPHAQFLALSATIRNAEEIAEWLKAKSITTEWRPIKLIEGVYLHHDLMFNDGSSLRLGEESYRSPPIDLAMYTVKHGGQALIFAETRMKAVMYAKKTSETIGRQLSKPEARTLKAIAERILTSGERTRLGDLLAKLVEGGAAFHHAGLSAGHRRIVEDAFRGGRIKVVCSTPTLAAGVNLPARMVIVSSYERYEVGYGRYPITVLEYKQMAGRAGRPKYDKVGWAVLVAKTEEEQDYLMENYVLARPERIWSKLAVEGVLRSHVLASMASGFAHTEKGLYDFFDRTFYAHQYDPRTIEGLVTKVLKFLLKEEMLAFGGNRNDLYATEFGRRVSELYIDPVSGVIIRDGLKRRARLLTDLSFLQMVCHTPDIAPKFYPRSREIDSLMAFVDAHDGEFMFPVPEDWSNTVEHETFLGEVKCAVVLEAWADEVSEDGIIDRYGAEPGDLFRLVETAKWLLYASYELSRLFGHRDLSPRLAELRERVEHGVKKEILPLVRLKGVGRVRGRMLCNAGFKSIEELKRASVEQITSIPTIGSHTAKRIKEQVGGLVRPEEWERLKRKKGWEQKAVTEY